MIANNPFSLHSALPTLTTVDLPKESPTKPDFFAAEDDSFENMLREKNEEREASVEEPKPFEPAKEFFGGQKKPTESVPPSEEGRVMSASKAKPEPKESQLTSSEVEHLGKILARLQQHLKDNPEAQQSLPKGLVSFLRSSSLGRLNDLLKGFDATAHSKGLLDLAKFVKEFGGGLEPQKSLKALLGSKTFQSMLENLKKLSEKGALKTKPAPMPEVLGEASSPSQANSRRGQDSPTANPTHASSVQQAQKRAEGAVATTANATQSGIQSELGQQTKSQPHSQPQSNLSNGANGSFREGSQPHGGSSNADSFANAFKPSNPSAWGKPQIGGRTNPTVNQHALIGKVAQNIRTAVVQGRETMQLSLKPEFLGNISIYLSKAEGKVVAKLLVDNPAVKELLESKIGELVEQLRHQKIDLNSLEVDINHQGKKPFDFGSSADNQSNSFYERNGKARPNNKTTKNEIDLRLLDHQLNIVI